MVVKSLKDGDYNSISEHNNMVEVLTTMEQQRVAGNADEWELHGNDGSLSICTVDDDTILILKVTDENLPL